MYSSKNSTIVVLHFLCYYKAILHRNVQDLLGCIIYEFDIVI